MSRVYSLGGRIFAPAEQTTVRQDGWLMVQLEDAGVLSLIAKGTAGLSDEAAARAVVVQAIRTEKYEAIVAGLLVEDGTTWSVDSALKNAEYFANLSDPESKETIRDSFVGILSAFFLNAQRSSTPSPTASTAPANARRTRKRVKPSTARPAAGGPTPPDGSPTATATD